MKNNKFFALFIATILISLIITFFAYLIWVFTALLGHLFIVHGIIVIWLILNALYLVYGLIHETIDVMMTIDKENNKDKK
jgi:hypothetical protein